MPIHEYVCKRCKLSKELLILKGDLDPKCPKCLKIMEKQISLSSFRLKGVGWYKDGYSKNS